MARRTRDVRSRFTLGRAVVPGFFLAAVYFAVFGGEYSVFELRRAHASIGEEQARLGVLRLEIDSLSAWADSLEHDAVTIERVAREDFGMIREGETLYRFADVDAEAEDGGPPAPER